MNASNFTTLGEPTRLKILHELTAEDLNVGELIARIKLNQPAISKYLKVLRDAGFVQCRIDAQRRVYRIESRKFKPLDGWPEPAKVMGHALG